MKLRKFQDYLELHSKDPKNFEKKVIFRGNQKCLDIFRTNEDLVQAETGLPTITWGESETANENFQHGTIPTMEKIYSDFAGENFLPKSTLDRAKVKEMKFPILGVTDTGNKEFKTYKGFKKSEQHFPVFREKIVPVTRFDVIVHKKHPIHLQEKINSLGFDVDQNRFKYLAEVESLAEKLGKEYDLDFYHISLIESSGKLYLEDLDCSINLSPSQSIKMYESAYEKFYETRLPVWFKKQLFENYIKPYYKKRYHDAALIKPKNSIDFKKYLD